MMRQHINFICNEVQLTGTLDSGPQATGLLIVSGGNEIRSGAHAGQARLAQTLSDAGYPVFRYDRRGVGDSEGHNSGFLETQDDIAAAIAAFRNSAPDVRRIVAFGNCDAATALVLFHYTAGIDALLLANPWVIEEDEALPPPSAIRNRYISKIKDPKALIDLFTGKVSFSKLAKGLRQASRKSKPSGLADRLGRALAHTDIPVSILLAKRDRTALAFHEAWKSDSYKTIAAKPNIKLLQIDSASHSFADAESKQWLLTQILEVLKA